MGSQYRNAVYPQMPQFTAEIADGYAVSQLSEEEVVGYIDRVLRNCEKNFPKAVEYIGHRRMRPQEVFKYFSEKKNDKNKRWDFARTDVYLMEYNFTFDGQVLGPYHIFLPFCDANAVSHINGKQFYNKPVMRDSVLQVTNNQIFLQFMSTPCTFSRLYYMILKNDAWESISIYHGCFHNVLRTVQQKKNKANSARITLNAHYLFVKYGFVEAFKKFANVEVKFGTRDELTEQGVNNKEWVTYASRGTTPYWVAKNEVYIPHDMRIAVRRENCNDVVECMIASAIYVFDLFPQDVKTVDVVNATWWNLMLGKIIFGGGHLPSSLIGKITEHIKATDNYVDEMSIESFEQNGIFVENMYDFLYYLIGSYDQIVHERSASPSSLLGRRLAVKQHVLSPIISNLFTAAFQIADIRPDKLSHKKVHDILVRMLKPKLIFANNRGKPFCVSISSPCDVKVFGTTSEVLPQDNTTGKKKQQDRSILQNPRWRLDSTFMTIGGAFAQSKGEPVGVDKINQFAQITSLGVLEHQDVLKDIAHRIDKTLQNE